MTVDPSTLIERLRQIDGLPPEFIRLVEAAADHVEWWEECAHLFSDLAVEEGAVSSINAVRAALADLAEALEGGE